LERGALPLVIEGKSNVVIRVSERADRKETMAAKWLAGEVAVLSGVTPEISTDLARSAEKGSETQLVLAAYQPAAKDLEQVLALLDDSDREAKKGDLISRANPRGCHCWLVQQCPLHGTRC
jgi:hypothetical protein